MNSRGRFVSGSDFVTTMAAQAEANGHRYCQPRCSQNHGVTKDMTDDHGVMTHCISRDVNRLTSISSGGAYGML